VRRIPQGFIRRGEKCEMAECRKDLGGGNSKAESSEIDAMRSKNKSNTYQFGGWGGVT